MLKERPKLLKQIKELKEKLDVEEYNFERWLNESNLKVYLRALKAKEKGKKVDFTKMKWMR